MLFGIRKEDVKIVLDILFDFVKWTINGCDPFLDDIEYEQEEKREKEEKEEQSVLPVQEESCGGHNGRRDQGSSYDNANR